MDTEESGGTNLRLRVSAWLPPGLALAWLATLTTLMRGVGIALAAWGATVSAIVLAVLLMHRLRAGSSTDSDDSAAGNGDAVAREAAQAGRPSATDPAEPVLRPTPAESLATSVKNPDPDPGPTTDTPIVPDSPVAGLRVLTAEEAALVLRVDLELVKTSITNGEFPGNRIGAHWRVEQGR